jgi:uncharacterized protein (TIGR02246 family)
MVPSISPEKPNFVVRVQASKWRFLVSIYKPILLTVFIFTHVVTTVGSGLSAEDLAKIKQVHRKYEEAWLKGDAKAVLALFTDDCVLLPPHGDKPRIGHEGLREFWFPPNAPPTQITKLVVTPQSIGGDEQIAYVWGTDDVAWTAVQDGKTVTASHQGIFLDVLQKQANGEWKLSHRMWDDKIERH